MSRSNGGASDGQSIRELVEFMTRAIVDDPKSVRTNLVESGSTIVVELSVAREDVGKVIGRNGAMAGALRTIVCNAASKLRKRTVLQIIE